MKAPGGCPDGREGSKSPKMASRRPKRPPRSSKGAPRAPQREVPHRAKIHDSLRPLIILAFSPFRLPDAP
eukprot:384238-Pyramimonas_sp.AAC.1